MMDLTVDRAYCILAWQVSWAGGRLMTDQIPGEALRRKLLPFGQSLLRHSISPSSGSLRAKLALRTHEFCTLSAKHIVSEPLALAGRSSSFPLLSD